MCERVYIVFENDGKSENIIAVYTFKYYAQRCIKNAKAREKRLCKKCKDRVEHTFCMKDFTYNYNIYYLLIKITTQLLRLI